MGLTVLVLCIASSLYVVHACPQPESIAPHCQCRHFSDGNMMFCKGLLSADQLISPVRELAKNNVRLLSLSIDNSSLLYIPHNLFKGLTIEKIRFVSTQLMSLSDSDVAFSGLENTLTELRATDAHYIAQWDWQQLKELKALELIDVNWISLGNIDDPFPELPKLTHLGIIRAEISFIVDDAFSNLPNLKIVNMKENDISELKRNMFPKPATNLIILDFSDNDLSHLPEDFFDGMPNLSDVHLGKNKFVTLHERPFSLAFEYLQELAMNDNPFRCDCRMRWTVGIRSPFTFIGHCAAPESLSGRSLTSLDLKSLWC